jgi:hypothetical protein
MLRIVNQNKSPNPTDEGLKALKNCKNLQRLWLMQTTKVRL